MCIAVERRSRVVRAEEEGQAKAGERQQAAEPIPNNPPARPARLTVSCPLPTSLGINYSTSEDPSG